MLIAMHFSDSTLHGMDDTQFLMHSRHTHTHLCKWTITYNICDHELHCSLFMWESMHLLNLIGVKIDSKLRSAISIIHWINWIFSMVTMRHWLKSISFQFFFSFWCHWMMIMIYAKETCKRWWCFIFMSRVIGPIGPKMMPSNDLYG